MTANPIPVGAAPRRILIRGVNWLGDAVMTTPALLRLREAHPRAHLTLLTQAKLADLWKHHPALDAVLEIQAHEGPVAVAKRLRVAAFDTALILPNSPRSALEMFLARIPHRIGYGRHWRNWLLTVRVPPRAEELRMHKPSPSEIRRLVAGALPGSFTPSPGAHQLYHYLHLAAALGAKAEAVCPLIAVSDVELEKVRERFGGPAGPRPSRPILLGLNASAEYGSAKRWPRDRFVAAAVALQRQLDCSWWVFGGPSDVQLAAAITSEIQSAQAGPPGSVSCLAGQTSLRELCAALRICDLVLTNDTGPMHLAAAVGTPVVVPFGSTSPELTCPGLPGDARHQFLRVPTPCAPCFLRECPIDFRCMNGIQVETVVAAVRRGLAA